jgi:hypothetical protein
VLFCGFILGQFAGKNAPTAVGVVASAVAIVAAIIIIVDRRCVRISIRLVLAFLRLLIGWFRTGAAATPAAGITSSILINTRFGSYDGRSVKHRYAVSSRPFCTIATATRA